MRRFSLSLGTQLVLEAETSRINIIKDMDSRLLPLHLPRTMTIRQEDIVLNVERRDKIREQDFAHHVVNHTVNNCADCI